jgi:hypothetical protein
MRSRAGSASRESRDRSALGDAGAERHQGEGVIVDAVGETIGDSIADRGRGALADGAGALPGRAGAAGSGAEKKNGGVAGGIASGPGADDTAVFGNVAEGVGRYCAVANGDRREKKSSPKMPDMACSI